MKLFRFLPWESALKSLENQNLRFGRIKELNDPFEVLPLFPAAPIDAIKWELHSQTMRDELHDSFGFLCFSEESTLLEPLMWSHYADHHKGAALGFGFDITTHFLESLDCGTDPKLPQIRKVDYPVNNIRVKLHEIEEIHLQEDPNEQLRLIQQMLEHRGIKLLTKKGHKWKYEKEWRCVCPLSRDGVEFKGGHYLWPMRNLKLSTIVLGCRNEIEAIALDKINPWGAEIRRLRPSKSKFELEFVPTFRPV
jgi:Protein of unknown function (DUF2971)